MGNTYYPQNDSELRSWMADFLEGLEPLVTEFRLNEDDFEELRKLSAEFEGALEDYTRKQIEARAACAHKTESREEMLEQLRRVVRHADAHPSMNNSIRAGLGLAPKGLVRQKRLIGQQTPLLLLETGPGRVTVHWGPNPGNERKNGKPDGVKGCNIYRRKAGEREFDLRAFATRSPYHDEVTGNAADWEYVAQYIGSQSVGPKCEPVVIAARGELAA